MNAVLIDPRTSEASKENSRKMIEVLEDPEQDPSDFGIGDSKREDANYEYNEFGDGDENAGNIAGGHKVL